jgi:hypothetical protein
MPKIQFVCENCGKTVEKYDSQASKFCSLQCYWEYKAKYQFEKICPVCETRFTGPFKQIYCSKACKRKRDHDEEVGQYIVTCPDCGEERILVRPVYGKRRGSELCKTCSGKRGREMYPTPTGDKSFAWKGGRRIDGYGYVKVHKKEHPFADSTGYVREHLYVAAEFYGVDYVRENGGTVHHINGDKQDNRIENLHVCTSEQNRQYTVDLLQIAYELVKKGMIEFADGEYRCPLLGDE